VLASKRWTIAVPEVCARRGAVPSQAHRRAPACRTVLAVPARAGARLRELSRWAAGTLRGAASPRPVHQMRASQRRELGV